MTYFQNILCRCWINLFIWNLPSFTRKLNKLHMLSEKYLNFFLKSLQECIPVGSFTCAEGSFISLDISSTLMHENWNVDPLVTLLLAMILGCFMYLKIAFNIRRDAFSAKGLTFSNSGIFRFLNGLEKKVFKISTFLAFCAKILSPSAS